MKKLFLSLFLVFAAGFVRADDTPVVPTTAVTPATAAGPLMAMCTLSPASGSKVSGWVKFTQFKNNVLVEGDVTGLTPGKHGFHIHDKGDCSAPDATSAGGHFNPTKKEHGVPNSTKSHMGDLGNITADASGHAKFKFKDKIIQLSGEYSIVDRAIIVHADLDDEKTQPTGNAGARVACGIIQLSQ
jgi:Cu-Zn family superoxide dismutase